MPFRPNWLLNLIPLIRRMQSCRFQCNFLICQKDTKAFLYLGTLARCQGQRPCRAKNRKENRVRAFSYDFPKLHYSNPNSFCANVHLRHFFFIKTVKVIERLHDVTPRSKYDKSKWHPKFPCAPNLVQFRQLFPELRSSFICSH